MRFATSFCVVLFVGGSLLLAQGTQGTARQPLEGVWRVTEIVVTGAETGTIASPQPSQVIFTKTHYSMMYVPGNKPRSLSKAENATDAEKLAAYDSFVANTGTYEVAGATLTI